MFFRHFPRGHRDLIREAKRLSTHDVRVASSIGRFHYRLVTERVVRQARKRASSVTLHVFARGSKRAKFIGLGQGISGTLNVTFFVKGSFLLYSHGHRRQNAVLQRRLRPNVRRGTRRTRAFQDMTGGRIAMSFVLISALIWRVTSGMVGLAPIKVMKRATNVNRRTNMRACHLVVDRIFHAIRLNRRRMGRFTHKARLVAKRAPFTRVKQ